MSAHEVAKHAGVSRSAVSRAFTPGASIAPETKQRIQRAAEALGYQVNDLARGLLANRSRLVGLVVTRPEVGFRSHLVASLTKALIARGSVPILINTGQTEDELLAAQRTLFGYRAEATIILSGSPPASFVELARQNGQPVVVIGRSEPDIDDVHIDNAGAARAAAALFVGRGMTCLGVASSRSGTPSVVERESGFVEEAGRLGVEVVVAQGVDSDYAGGLDAAERLLAGPRKPQGVFCVNDLVAFGMIDHACRRAGLNVPDDLAVIGFDDLPEANWLGHDLTTFRQDPDIMAETAIELLDRREADPARPPERIRIEATLVVRGSFDPAAGPPGDPT